MSGQIELRLQEMAMPSGEISLADLAAISGRLQELSTRVSRWVAEIEGPGRSPGMVESAATLRLSGLTEGSTVLEINRGSHDTLPFDLPFEDEVTAKYWEIIAALSTDAPPADTPTPVRESAVGLLDALQHAAERVTLSSADGARVEFWPAQRDRAVWRATEMQIDLGPITVLGRLEMVDLRNRKFRIADDVGNRITLDEVENAEAVSRELVGMRVTAAGVPTHDKRGRLLSITAPMIEPATVPAQWQSHTRPSVWSLPDTVIGPDPDGGADFDDDEWAEFLAAVTGK